MTSWRIHRGHVLDVLAELPAASVHCVVTSPPYWGLRDYGLPATRWGGDPTCQHDWQERANPSKAGGGTEKQRSNAGSYVKPSTSELCASCGAWWGQLGLEPTIDLYVAHLVDVFAAVRRVLRPDGTVWLNMGDSYATGAGRTGRGDTDRETPGGRGGSFRGGTRTERPQTSGAKPKDLLLMPARIALALQAAGWHVRAEVVWAKPNPMPESVRDRPTRAHEFVYLLAPGRRYFYDRAAVLERSSALQHPAALDWSRDTKEADVPGQARHQHRGDRVKVPQGWDMAPGRHDLVGHRDGRATGTKYRTVRPGIDTNGGGQGNGAMTFPTQERNLRDVWTIPTEGWAEAHFATFPTALVVPCVKAGTSERGCCPECGAPWQREVARQAAGAWKSQEGRGGKLVADQDAGLRGADFYAEYEPPTTTGWRASCEHEGESVPCTVLDPFAGSGTAGVVALGLGRSFVGIELSPEYAEMAERRIHNEAGLFSVQPEADTPAAPPSDPAEPPAELFGGPA